MKPPSIVLATLALAGACADEREPPPIIWEGEHLRFGTEEDESTICGGTLTYLDQTVGHLVEVFDRPDIMVDYYWLPDGVEAFCDSDTLGCSSVDGAFSRFAIHQHELTHAVRYPSGLYQPLEEGLADAFGDDWDPPPYDFEGEIEDLLQNPGQHLPGDGYALAGHFVSYLRTTHGIDPLIALDSTTEYDSSFSAVEPAFEQAFGISLDDAITDYETSYPRCPLRAYRDKTVDCDRNVLPAPAEVGARVDHVVPLACDDPTVLGPRSDERWNTVALDVQVPGIYYFLASPQTDIDLELIRLTSCDLDCFDFADDAFSHVTGTEIGFGECLSPGRYLFRFASKGEGTGGVELVVSYDVAMSCE